MDCLSPTSGPLKASMAPPLERKNAGPVERVVSGALAESKATSPPIKATSQESSGMRFLRIFLKACCPCMRIPEDTDKSQDLVINDVVRDAEEASKRDSTLLALVRKHSTQGYFEEAAAIANRMANESTKGFCLLDIVNGYTARVHAQKDFKNLEKAYSIARNITDERYRDLSLGEVVQIYIRQDDLKEACKVAKGIRHAPQRDALLSDIAKKHIADGNYAATTDVAQDIEEPDKKDYILSALVGEYIAQKGLENLAKAHSIARNITDERSRDRSLRAVAHGYFAHWEWSAEVRSVANDIREPSWHDYLLSGVVNAYIRHRDLAAALSTAKEMKGAPSRDCHLYSIAEAHIERGNFAGALTAAENISKPSNRDSCMSGIIVKRHIAKGDFGEARKAAKETRDPSKRDSLLSDVAENYIARGDLAAAFDVAQDIQDIKETLRRDFILSAIAQAYVAQGQLEKAAAVADIITGELGRCSRLHSIVQGYVARKNFKEAHRTANKLKDRFDRDVSLSMIAKECIACGELKEARAAANVITCEFKQNSLLSHIAEIYIANGNFKGACGVAESIKDWSKKISILHKIPGDILFQFVLDLIEQNNLERAANVAGCITSTDSFKRDFWLCHIVKAYIVRDYPDLAFIVAGAIRNESVQSKIYAALSIPSKDKQRILRIIDESLSQAAARFEELPSEEGRFSGQ